MSPFDNKHTNHQKTPLDIHGRRPKSIQDWMFSTSVAMQDIPLSSSDKSNNQESSNSSISESQLDTLMKEYAAVREKMEKIEDKIAELYYARQPNSDTASSAFYNANSSESQKDSSDKGKPTVEKRQDSPSTEFSDYKDYLHPNQIVGKRQESPSIDFSDHKDYFHANQGEDKAKNREVKKPKTEEEKNRHINKVFIRENP
ncbi:unnamed protein product [Fusarium langsethiae]|nr:unnamed protein product [Fusarium langsethiae]